MVASDLLLAATLCPGVSGERLVPRLVAALAGRRPGPEGGVGGVEPAAASGRPPTEAGGGVGLGPAAAAVRRPPTEMGGGGRAARAAAAAVPPPPTDAGVGCPGDRAAAAAAAAEAALGPAAAARWRVFLAGPAAAAVAAERAALAAADAALLTPLDPEWPEGLPPRGLLRVQGRLPGAPRVAIVGARGADRYGRDVARRAGEAAAAAGVVVVSGGALGTDAAAHRGCLDAGGPTVVVLGSGLARPSPPSHRGLFERVRAQGAVVSPFPCALAPGPHTFPRRNAWIAGLAALTVVLQAGAHSGSLHTARAALALGRPLYALPGPIDSPLHAGVHALLGAGARLLAHPGAFLDDSTLGALGVDNSVCERTMASRGAASSETGPSFGQALWRAAGAEAVALASLAAEAGMPAGDAAALALQLELAGWLRAFPGGRFARCAPPAAQRSRT